MSRRAFDIVIAECLRLLDEKKQYLAKIERMERALLKAAPTPEAQEYMRRIEPPPPMNLDPKPVEPGANAQWDQVAAYYLDLKAWETRHKATQ